jgi:hypothetical protein
MRNLQEQCRVKAYWIRYVSVHTCTCNVHVCHIATQNAWPEQYSRTRTLQDTEDAVRQHLLRFDSGDADVWACLDDSRLHLVNPIEGGRNFWVTLHCQQKLPEFILQPSVVRDSLKPWTEGTRVRMWFWNEDGVSGSYYTGVVLEQSGFYVYVRVPLCVCACLV